MLVELGADELVVVERDAATVLEASGGGLADVVEQRSEAQHEVGTGHGLGRSVSGTLEVDGLLEDDEGVVVDVLVPVVLVELEPQGRQLGEEHVGEPGVDEERQPEPRA